MAEEQHKRYTDEEREYYESEVEEAAQKATKAPDKETERLVRDIVESSEVHEDLKLRMYRDVMTRLKSLKEAARSEREKKVLKEYEGYVQSIDGKFRPAGIDKKFKVTVRAGAGWNVKDLTEHGYEGSTAALYAKSAWWKTGKMFDRMFGRTVDSDSFHKIIEDVEKAREDVDTLKRELELLRASEKSIGALISMSGSGFFARVRSRGITSVLGAGVESTGDFFNGLTEKYWGADRKREKEVSILIAQKMKDLKEKEALRDATLKKLDELREGGKVLFDKAFKPEVDVLMTQKEHMSDAEYQKKLDDLRKKIIKWSEKTGFVHMEVFLDEMLGVKSEAKPELSDLEVKKRKAKVSAFLKEVTGEAPKENETEQFTNDLASEDPDTLKEITEGTLKRSRVQFLQFLVRGKYRHDITLSKDRVMKPTNDNLLDYLKLSADYIKESRFEDSLRTFATTWTGVKAEKFDDVFDLILAGRSPEGTEKTETEEEAKEKERRKVLLAATSAYYKDVTGEQPDETAAEKVVTEGLKNVRSFEQFLRNPAKKGIMRFFFSGVYEGSKRPLMFREERLLEPSADNFLQTYARIQKFVELTTNPRLIRKVFIEFVEGDEYASRPFSDLDEALFEEIMKKVQMKKEEKKARKTEEKKEKSDARKAAKKAAERPPAPPVVHVHTPAPVVVPPAVTPAAPAPIVPPAAPVAPPAAPVAPPAAAAPKAAPASTPPPSPSSTPPSSPSSVEVADESGMTVREKKELLQEAMNITKKRANDLFSKLGRDFEWKLLKKFDREIRFLFTGKYVSRDGNKIIALEGDNPSAWNLMTPSITNLKKLMRPSSIAALEKIERRLGELLKDSGYTQSTVSFFIHYMLEGRKFVPSARSSNAEGSRSTPAAPQEQATKKKKTKAKRMAASSSTSAQPTSVTPAEEETTPPAPQDSNQLATLGEIASRNETVDAPIELNTGGLDDLIDALDLGDDRELAKKMYDNAFLNNKEWRDRLAKPANREKLRFFVTGKYKKFDVSPARLEKITSSLDSLLEIFMVVCKANKDLFSQRIRSFFKDAPRTVQSMLTLVKEFNNPTPNESDA